MSSVFSRVNVTSKCAAFAVAAAAAATLTLGAAAAYPAQALANEGDLTYTQDGVEKTEHFTDVSSLLSKASSAGGDVTISLSDDWYTGDLRIDIPKDRNYTINMNGHMINRQKTALGKGWYGKSDWGVIELKKNATLTINGGATEQAKSIEHKGSLTDVKSNGAAFWTYDGKGDTVIKGGLITGGANDDGGGAIEVFTDAKLYLNNVTVAGNIADEQSNAFSGSGGGICLDSSGTQAVLEDTKVIYNHAEANGGGVALKGAKSLVLKGASRISNNLTAMAGGGIYVYLGNCQKVTLNEKSAVSDNCALYSAGGLNVSQANSCEIGSDDGTGVIEGNISGHHGGAIVISSTSYACAVKNLAIRDNSASQCGGGLYFAGADDRLKHSVENVILEGNSAAEDGGGVYADFDTDISGSTLTGNTAGEDGGGIFINDGNCSVNDCTIKGNVCNNSSESYEGGGIFVPYKYDLSLSGLCIIKGNTRKGGTMDDVFLSNGLWNLTRAYVKGGVKKGSCIGVRTGITGDRRIGDNIKNESKDCFFIDQTGYYVSYGDDHGGDMWQRHSALQYLLQMNGQDFNHYNYGDAVTANGTTTDRYKTFWYWDAASATGLYPVSDYITAESKYNPLLSFSMPQWDVSLKAVYADQVKEGAVILKAPVAGEELPTTASFMRTDEGEGGQAQVNGLPITWYEIGEDGSKIAVAGKARTWGRYVASISIAQQKEQGLFFMKTLAGEDISVRTDAGNSRAVSAAVDASAGALTVETEVLRASGKNFTGAKTGTVTIELENGGLGADAKNSSSLGLVNVSYAVDSGSVTVSAPSCEGYNFCYWSDVPSGVDTDNESGTATFNASDFKDALKLSAVYTPKVTAVDLGMAAPAAGEELAEEVTSIKVTCSDGQVVELLDAFADAGSLPVSWSPSASGKAACSTAYAATVVLDDEGNIDAEDVISLGVQVSANHVAVEGAAAGFTLVGGKLALCAAFPATADKAVADKAAAKAVTGKTVTVKASKKTGKTAKAKSVKIKAAKSASGAKASFKLVSGPKQVKLSAKTGKVTLKKGAAKGKTYKAKIKVTYGDAPKTVTVKFKVK